MSARSARPYVLVLAAGTLALLIAPPGRVPAGAATPREKHGGDIVFEVKENRQRLPHVLFSHASHLDAGHECKDCHNGKVFSEEKDLGANSFTMKDILRGEACGACHDGRTVVEGVPVFAPKKNCTRCHDTKWRPRRGR